MGYYVESQAETLIPAARLLTTSYGATFDTVFADAFKEAGLTDRRWMKDLTRDDYIQLGKSSSFANGTAENRALLHWVYAIAAVSGWGDYRPPVVRYAAHPHMTLDEILLECLNDHLDKGLKEIGAMWPEKCNVEAFRTHLASCIKRAAILYEYRPYIVDKLERYIGDVLYKLRHGEISPTGLTQFDRTLLTKLVYEADPNLLSYTLNGVPTALSFSPNKDANPLIAPEIDRIRNACKEGPWLKYTRLLSNMDQRELIYMLTPVLPDLPLATGFLMPVGPFHEVDLTIQHRITWGDQEQYAGFAERVVFPAFSTASNNRINLRTPAKKDVASKYVQQIYDWPTLEIVDDYDFGNQKSGTVTPFSFRYSWFSPTLQRMVHSDAGGDMDALLYDLACTHKELGETPVTMVNIHDFKWADLTKISNRRIIAGPAQNPQDDPRLRSRVRFDIYYMSGGKTLKKETNVDLTPLYNKLGNITYRPALAEYFEPSRTYFLTLDQNTIDYICGKLRLNVYDAQRSKLAIAISHNVAMYKRVTGRQEDPFDVEELIKAMYGMIAPASPSLPNSTASNTNQQP